MGLFGFGGSDEKDDVPIITAPVDPGWVTTHDGGFFEFYSLDPEEMGLGGVSGVYLIWHGGVRPEWVFAGHTTDMAAAFHSAAKNHEVTNYERNGGLFVAWAPVMEPYRPGVVKYLELSFKTLVPNPGQYTEDTRPVPVFPPKRRTKKK
jgi:hypothetical protein